MYLYTLSEIPAVYKKSRNVQPSIKVTRDAKSNVLIPTEQFLNASGDFLPILDKLGSKAFQPVKMDISGNITKIRTKYDTDTDKFTSLQAGVDNFGNS